MRSDGLALLTEVCSKIQCSVQEAQQAVVTNNKQRFAIIDIDGSVYIRANQGHSIPVPDLELKRITSESDIPCDARGKPSVIVHGTYFKVWPAIKENGLSKMSRNHIHFAVGTPQESHVISGMRASCELLIYIDLNAAIHDGFDFFVSENHVVLCSGDIQGYLPTKYFKAVLDASTQQPYDSDFPNV